MGKEQQPPSNTSDTPLPLKQDAEDRTYRFPPNTMGTLRGKDPVRVISFTSDKPLRLESGRFVTEWNPSGTWLVEHGPLSTGTGQKRVAFADVADVRYWPPPKNL